MASAYLGEDTEKLLGTEFLTWLWYKSETENTFMCNEKEFSTYIERRITVANGEGQTAEMASASGPASELKEARFGLAEGKTVTRATIRIEQDSDVWLVSLKSSDFSLAGVRTPKLDTSDMDEEDEDGVFLEKMHLLETMISCIETLYQQFLHIRMHSSWVSEVKLIQGWVKKTLEG